VTALGLVAGLGAGLALLAAAGCDTPVQQGLEERQANRIVTALQGAGLQARKVKEEGRDGKFAVEVPRGQVSRAIRVLLEQELPRRRPPGFGEVYGKPSLVPTATEQQARYVHALSGEIARTLEAVSGVREARVHVVVPRRDPLALQAEKSEPRAAVFLRVAPGKHPITGAEVQRLVAGSVDELAPAKVSVVIRPSRPPPEPTEKLGLASVGPVSVSPDSRSLLQWLLAGGLVLIVLLAGAVAFLVVRLGRLRARLAEPSTAAPVEPESTGRLPGEER
jgi:type III secretion protein J